ncbi:MAG: flagellar motor switch protein FliM [Kineosporiaceae bacterium]
MGYSDQATAPHHRRRRGGEAKSYDFRRPVRLAREHAHLLRVAMNTFGRQSSTVLTTTLRAVCTVAGGELEELSYDEYLTQLPEGSVSAVLSFEPLPGKALFNLDLTTLLMWVDHMLGGPGTPQQPDRPLTDIEQSLVRHILTRLLRELAYALEPVASVRPQLLALESNAQFVQAAAATDPVVVAHLEMQVGDRSSTATLCLPYAMLAPALDAIDDSKQDGERARQRLEASKLTTRRLADVAVDVAVRFDPLRLPSSRLASLAVGDVLTLDHRTTTPLTVVSASTVFARAVPGASGRRLAVLIVDPDSPAG